MGYIVNPISFRLNYNRFSYFTNALFQLNLNFGYVLNSDYLIYQFIIWYFRCKVWTQYAVILGSIKIFRLTNKKLKIFIQIYDATMVWFLGQSKRLFTSVRELLREIHSSKYTVSVFEDINYLYNKETRKHLKSKTYKHDRSLKDKKNKILSFFKKWEAKPNAYYFFKLDISRISICFTSIAKNKLRLREILSKSNLVPFIFFRCMFFSSVFNPSFSVPLFDSSMKNNSKFLILFSNFSLIFNKRFRPFFHRLFFNKFNTFHHFKQSSATSKDYITYFMHRALFKNTKVLRAYKRRYYHIWFQLRDGVVANRSTTTDDKIGELQNLEMPLQPYEFYWSPLTLPLYTRYLYAKFSIIKRWCDLKIIYWNTILGFYDVFLTSYYVEDSFAADVFMREDSIGEQKEEIYLDNELEIKKTDDIKKLARIPSTPRQLWFWFMIERYLIYKISKLSNYFKKDIEMNMLLVSNPYKNAIFVLSDIIMALRYRVPARKVMRHMSIKLMNEDALLGFKLVFSGRYSRRQRSKIFWKFQNMRGLGKLYGLVDYAFGFARLKYGVCGIKLWLIRARLSTEEASRTYSIEKPLSYNVPMKIDFNVYFVGFNHV